MTVTGADGKTYAEFTTSQSITGASYNNSLNYYGSTGINVFEVPSSTTVTSFTNSGIILGGGGNYNGGNGLQLLSSSSTITTLVNTGSFLGGGGGSSNGTNGGAGGGGGGSLSGGVGGSIVGSTTTNGSDGGDYGTYSGGGGGGGPSGNGGGSHGYLGGTGGGCPGANGSNNGNGNSCISSIFTFGGGGGACSTPNEQVTGGGGYGGGNGGPTFSGYGGGGGGGGVSYYANNLPADFGKGGYGIDNSGNITTLSNGQGGTYTVTNGSNKISYGPLFYSGNLPTNYNIIINNSVTNTFTQYGQLWCTGWAWSSYTSDTSFNFGIDSSDSSLDFYTTQGTTCTYKSIIVLPSTSITVNGTSGNFTTYTNTSITNVFDWSLSDSYEFVLNGTTYYSYDLTLTLTYVFNNITTPFSITSYHSSCYYSLNYD